VHTINDIEGITNEIYINRLHSDQNLTRNLNITTENMNSITEMNGLFTLPYTRERAKSFYEETNAKRKWIKLSNVLKGINLMKRNMVQKIDDPNDIVESINKSPRRKRTLTSMSSINLT
jgi:hypothetical protein